jgi:hypothetical protein
MATMSRSTKRPRIAAAAAAAGGGASGKDEDGEREMCDDSSCAALMS